MAIYSPENDMGATSRNSTLVSSSANDSDPTGVNKDIQDRINSGQALAKKLQDKKLQAKRKNRSVASSKPSSAITSKLDTNAMAKAASGADLSSSGGTASTLGDIGLASGNPYGMAAGAALKVIGAVQAKKAAAAKLAAANENARRSKLMQAMAQLGSGVGSLGMA